MDWEVFTLAGDNGEPLAAHSRRVLWSDVGVRDTGSREGMTVGRSRVKIGWELEVG
jgi:hypothetical protein